MTKIVVNCGNLPKENSLTVYEINILDEYSIRGNIIDYNDLSMKAFCRTLPHKYCVRVFKTNILQEYSICGNTIDYNDVSMKVFSRRL